MNPERPHSPTLTDQQARPLSVRDASVALSAGAGCGKTTVLTERFLRELEERSLNALAALTFTEKAARELRQRIRARCRKELDRGADATRSRAILRALEAAPIGTFHEYCGAWLRAHAGAAGIDPDFRVLDESIAATIRDEALGARLRRWLAEQAPDLIALGIEFGLRQTREALDKLLRERASGALEEWIELEPEAVVARWKLAWEERGRAALLRPVVEAARSCRELLERYADLPPKMIERRAALLELLPESEARGHSADWLGAVKEHARVQGTTRPPWPDPEVYETVKNALTCLRDAIEDYIEKSEWDEAATLDAAANGLRFARLALEARTHYQALKRARGGLDFDDLMLLTRDVLRAHPEAADSTLERLLVDEFQDTDPTQSEILERLSGMAVESGRLFLVGDFKQSIYRFRGAQPTIFQEFRARFPAPGRLDLTENFRSVPGLLDFVNALFGGVFPDPGDALTPGPRTPPRDDLPAVEFLWLPEEHETATEKPTAAERRQSEARGLARRLRARLEEGWIVRDRATGTPRRAGDGDVAFLFRALTDLAPYESALVAEGFDYHTVGGSAFYAQQEIQDLVNLLSALDDPLDAVSLAGALRSPFFGISDNALYWLGTTGKGDLGTALERTDEIETLAADDRRQALRARDLLGRWRALKDRLPIAALVDRVLDESGYEAALLGEFLGARKRANARKLVRLARAFDQEGGFTLAAFVARLRADLRTPPREEQASTTDEEGTSVRLMSIHKAKGLEFPIVVLPDLNRRPAPRTDGVAFHRVLGPLARPSKDQAPPTTPGAPVAEGNRKSLGWMLYQALEAREEEDEVIRLFYVATTRARDSLILSAGETPSASPSTAALKLLAERFDRANGACRVALPEGWRAPAIAVTAMDPTALGETAFASRATLPLDAVATTIEQEPAPAVERPPTRPPRPRFVPLDPAWGLPPTSARRDALVRAILGDPDVLSAPDWPKVAARRARRADPFASGRLVDEAIAWLRPWLEGRLARVLDGATDLERAVAWTLAWPPGTADGTVFAGTIDLIGRDPTGAARLISFSDRDADAPRARLRLLLSARAANALGLGPIRQAWRIALGPDGGLHGEEHFENEVIDRALGDAGF